MSSPRYQEPPHCFVLKISPVEFIAKLVQVVLQKIIIYPVMHVQQKSFGIAYGLVLSRAKILIHHSDRGGQYWSDKYTSLLKGQGTKISMELVAYDNAYAERVNGTIKNEY